MMTPVTNNLTRDRFVDWCDQNYLQLNIGKTKEMVIDFRRKVPVYNDVVAKGETVEKVETYRYLGIVTENKLSWKQNLKYIIKKTHSRLYCLRKLRSFNVSTELLQMFYTSAVSSVLTFGSACWGGNSAKQDKDRLEKKNQKGRRDSG